MPGISQKMLIQQLRGLEGDRIVARKMYPEVPPKVEYRLTEEGKPSSQLSASFNRGRSAARRLNLEASKRGLPISSFWPLQTLEISTDLSASVEEPALFC